MIPFCLSKAGKDQDKSASNAELTTTAIFCGAAVGAVECVEIKINVT